VRARYFWTGRSRFSWAMSARSVGDPQATLPESRNLEFDEKIPVRRFVVFERGKAAESSCRSGKPRTLRLRGPIRHSWTYGPLHGWARFLKNPPAAGAGPGDTPRLNLVAPAQRPEWNTELNAFIAYNFSGG